MIVFILNNVTPIDPGAGPKGDSILRWIAVLHGPRGTPYEGGTFFVDLEFAQTYPFTPPKVKFLTRVYCCNVESATGVPGLPILAATNWRPAMTMSHVLRQLCAMLETPNPDAPAEPAIANQYLHDREKHDETARDWTRRFAR